MDKFEHTKKIEKQKSNFFTSMFGSYRTTVSTKIPDLSLYYKNEEWSKFQPSDNGVTCSQPAIGLILAHPFSSTFF